MYKIIKVEINKQLGTVIDFTSKYAFNFGDKLLLEYQDFSEFIIEKYFFEVISISFDSSQVFLIKACQVGHWVNNLKLKKDLDFTSLLDSKISLIEDRETIHRIDKESGWC